MLNLEEFQGLIIILLIIFIIIFLIKKAVKFAIFCFCILALMQIGFMLSKTSINDSLHLDKYFKYDIISSIETIWNDEIDKTEIHEKIQQIHNN